MAHNPISRRMALRKLGLGVLAAYSVPEMLMVSSAAASTTPTAPTEPTAPSESSSASGPSSPEVSLPSGPAQETWNEEDTCGAYSARGDQVTISNSDFRRAQRAVRRGEAMTLNDVFRSVQGQVRGKLIEVRFNNLSNPPIYQFRMVSERGKLITIFTDASNARILRIVNC